MDIIVLDEYNNDEIKTVERLSMETDVVPPEQKSSVMKQISYLLLIVGMLGISTGGVAFRMIPDQVAPILASLWRAEVTFVCLLPFLIVELLRMPRESLIKLSKDYKVWLMILYCGIASAMWTGKTKTIITDLFYLVYSDLPSDLLNFMKAHLPLLFGLLL